MIPERLNMDDPVAQRLWNIARELEETSPRLKSMTPQMLANLEFEEWEAVLRSTVNPPLSYEMESAAAALIVAMRAARPQPKGQVEFWSTIDILREDPHSSNYEAQDALTLRWRPVHDPYWDDCKIPLKWRSVA